MSRAVADRTAVLSGDVAQHAANVAFARAYRGRSFAGQRSRPRVLVSGFGRFPAHDVNATATLVCALAGVEPPRVPAVALEAGLVDDPSRHVVVADFVMDLPRAGAVDARAIVLPVFWDVAAVVLLREIDAFQPDVVMMNGIGRDEQPIVLEQGALNRAAAREDGSLRVRSSGDEIVIGGPAVRVLGCAAREVALAAGMELGEARADNAYLCNQLAYLVDHAMARPRVPLCVLRRTADDPGLALSLDHDLRTTPRMFVHWPALTSVPAWDLAADVVRRAVDEQLARGKVDAQDRG